MKITKKIEIGNYIIVIEHDDSDETLDVTILDELEDVIESITISNDNDPEGQNEIDPTLN